MLERTHSEPHFRGAPFVLVDGGRLRMWYVSSAHWEYGSCGLRYRVSIRHAVSSDGVEWRPEAGLCLEPEGDEYAVGRPCVVREGGIFRMWYSVRSVSRPYAIGYAESPDGLSWRRMDGQAGITRSHSGWDSEMICFPNVVDAAGQRYLFYNGNRHGASGFGCAVWADGGVGPGPLPASGM